GIGVYSQSTFTFFLRTEVSSGAADAGQIAFGNPNFLPVAGIYALPAHLLLAPGSAPTPAAADLSNAQLHAAVAGARARLGAAGVDPSVLGSLATADYEVGTLPAGILGESNVPGRRVTISADASGQGWFVDPTPLQDEEFAGGPAMGTMDLLTAVLHEMGHLAGRPAVSAAADPPDLTA